MKIGFFTNIAPHYRTSLWLSLLYSFQDDIEYYFGKNNPKGIKTIDFDLPEFLKYSDQLHELRNFWLQKKILIWQSGVIYNCIIKKYDTCIFLGEMYCISTWISALICRLRNTEVVFWGHGFYGNESKIKKWLRKSFYRLANKHLLYERRSKKLMAKEGFDEDSLYVVFNSLDYDQHKTLRDKYLNCNKQDYFPFFQNPNLPTLIFIGRLTIEKKLPILIDALKRLNNEESRYNLIIIGEGAMRRDLNEMAERGIKEKWLYFKGACYQENELSRLLSLADLCISPGNVGLTAIHSLSFGTPVCTHGNLNNQMPEVESISIGETGFFFEENDVEDLTNKIADWFSNNSSNQSLRSKCYEVVDELYNPNYQIKVINRLLSNETPLI